MSHTFCSACNKLMVCESADNASPCWCHNLPNIVPILVASNKPTSCLCQDCLIEQLNQVLESYYQKYTQSELVEFVQMYRLPQTDLEGLDFIREGQVTHPTKWHLLKLGECCQQDCKYCPYHD